MKPDISISAEQISELNRYLGDPSNPVVKRIGEIVDKFGGAAKINAMAEESGSLPRLMEAVKGKKREYFDDLQWLIAQRDQKRFVSMEDYIKSIPRAGKAPSVDPSYRVTLEISALQYFPWIMAEARQAIEKRELMPGRFIRVRAMAEQEEDGDLPAVIAAMKILGASWVEALDTKGTDGSNIHLGGPETITGYFGGIGEPNDYPYRWIEEYLHYYTKYGVRQVLNINGGTILAAYLLYRMGVDIQFKISVFVGNDNPLMALWTLMTAKIFAREDGSTPLIGFNLSNAVNNWTIEQTAAIRKSLGFEEQVRIEHHILESYRSIVKQPYDRLGELVDIAKKVKNISAKHEGGLMETEKARSHPSDILEYFLPKRKVIDDGLWDALEQNYLDKHDALQATARRLLENGVPVLAAPTLHYR